MPVLLKSKITNDGPKMYLSSKVYALHMMTIWVQSSATKRNKQKLQSITKDTAFRNKKKYVTGRSS